MWQQVQRNLGGRWSRATIREGAGMVRAAAMATAHGMIGGLVDVCFPPTCVLCQGPLETSFAARPISEDGPAGEQDADATDADRRPWQCRTLCWGCQRLLCAAAVPRNCERCGRAIPEVGDSQCAGCQRRSPPIGRLYVLGMYRDCLREAVIAAKRSAHAPLALALGDLLGRQLQTRVEGCPWTAVTYVPSYWTRRWQRGGSPSQLIADRVARALDVPLWNVLRALRATKKQGTLGDAERRRNVRGAFAAKKGYALNDQRILVVDDVWTTGSTLCEAAGALNRCYGAQVDAAVVARAVGGHHG